MELRFLFKSSSGKPRVHVKRLPVVVGRSDAEDIKLRIPTDSVSRRHCEFFQDKAGTVLVRDLHSANGTLLDGKPIERGAAVPVRSGCIVKLGTVRFRVEYNPARAAREHESDTIPIEGGDSPAPEPAPAPTQPTRALPRAAPSDEPAGPLEPDLEPATDDAAFDAAALDAAALDAAGAPPAPAAGDFAFLGEAVAAEPADEPQWPVVDEGPAPDDEGLDNFFKGLS